MSTHGNGHMKQLPDGRYFIQCTLGSRAGKQIRKSKICKTKREAIQFRNDMAHLAKRNQLVENSDIKFGEWLDLYFSRYVDQQLKIMTANIYKKTITKIQSHRIASIRLQRLTRKDIQFYVDELSDTLAPSTVIGIASLISKALRYAEMEELLPVSPYRNIMLPKLKRVRKTRIFTAQEEQLFLEAITGHHYEAMFRLSMLGLRRSELCGLQVEDVDLEKKLITIAHQFQKMDVGSILVPYTKTNRSRTIPVPNEICVLLERHIAGRTQGHLFLTWQEPHRPLSSSGYAYAFKSVLEQAGLPDVTLHSLRHLCASRMISSHVNPRAVADFLGHSTVKMTLNTYSHSCMDDLKEALDAINPK